MFDQDVSSAAAGVVVSDDEPTRGGPGDQQPAGGERAGSALGPELLAVGAVAARPPGDPGRTVAHALSHRIRRYTERGAGHDLPAASTLDVTA